MKTLIWLIVIAMAICLVAGCGPGQPFEIEGRRTLQHDTHASVAADVRITGLQGPLNL